MSINRNNMNKDTRNRRSMRLRLLGENYSKYSAELPLPVDIVSWIDSCLDNWEDARTDTEMYKGKVSVAYEVYQTAFKDAGDYYVKLKQLLLALINDLGKGDEVIPEYGIVGVVPARRALFLTAVEQFKKTSDDLRDAGDGRVLDAGLVNRLVSKADASYKAWHDAQKQQQESVLKTAKQRELYTGDTIKLRYVYAAAVLAWGKKSLNLPELGFEVVHKTGRKKKIVNSE